MQVTESKMTGKITKKVLFKAINALGDSLELRIL
jgi:hypothetical protein